MKILVAHPRMDEVGGGERVCLSTVEALAERGHEVHLLAERFDEARLRRLLGRRIPAHRILRESVGVEYRPWPKLAALGRALTYSFHRWRLKLRLSSYDLIIGTHEGAVVVSPDVQYVHSPLYWPGLKGAWGRGLRKLYYEPIRRFWDTAISSIRLMLANSNYTSDLVLKLWGKKAATVYPPCDVKAFKPSPEKADMVVSVCRISPEKNLEALLKIAEGLPEVPFVLIGGLHPEDRTYVERLLKAKPKNVIVKADASFEELRAILGRAKVYVHTMTDEPFGIAICEAMASGCVPIVHNSGGQVEIVGGGSGYRWSSVEEAIGQIRLLLEERALFSRMSRLALKRAREFDEGRFKERIVGAIRDALKVEL